MAALVTPPLDDNLMQKVYAQLANVYDVVFGAILQPGREAAVDSTACGAAGRVLEVGIGTGLTVPAYPPGCRVTGVDFSADMLAQARRRVANPAPRVRVSLIRGDAARLPFGDDLFDAVLAPYVMSVVSDPLAAGRELARVCRPGGKVVLLNHFASESPVVARLERLATPLTRYAGFRADLPLEPILAASGLRTVSIRRVNLPPFWKLIVCSKDVTPAASRASN